VILREPPPAPLGPSNVRRAERENERGRFEGVELRIGVSGAGPALRIFTGVEEAMLAAVRTGDVAEVRTRRRRRETQEPPADGLEAPDADDDTTAVSVDEDAALLEARLVDSRCRRATDQLLDPRDHNT
jgi:hypothetical protein